MYLPLSLHRVGERTMRKDMRTYMQSIEYRTSVDYFTHLTYLFHRVAMFILVLVLCDIHTATYLL